MSSQSVSPSSEPIQNGVAILIECLSGLRRVRRVPDSLHSGRQRVEQDGLRSLQSKAETVRVVQRLDLELRPAEDPASERSYGFV